MKRSALLFTLLAASQSALACLDGTETGIVLENFNDFSIPHAPKVINGKLIVYGSAGEIVSINSSSGVGYCILANTGVSYSAWEVSGVTGDVKFIQGNDGLNQSFQVVARDFPGQPLGFTDYVSFPRNLSVLGGNQPIDIIIGGDRETGLDEPAADYAGVVEISGNLTIITKNFDDEVYLGNTSIAGITTVRTGGGNDKIGSDKTYPPAWGSFLNIDTGSGDDVFDLGLETYVGGASIRMGSGNDLLAGINRPSAYEQEIYPAFLISYLGRRVSVNMGTGDDISSYQVYDFDVDSDLVHNDGSGNDSSELIADKIRYIGGLGDDTLFVNQTVSGSNFNGGSGNDVLNRTSETQGVISNFENVFLSGEQQFYIAEVNNSGDVVVELFESFSQPHPESVEGPYQLSISAMPSGGLFVSASFCSIFEDSDSCGTLTQEIVAGTLTRDLRINTNSTDVSIVGITVPRNFVFQTLRPLSGLYALSEFDGMSLDMSDTNVGGNLSVRGNTHDDFVSLRNVSVDGFANVNAASGNDDIAVVGSTFNDKFIFNGSSGDDVACIQSSYFTKAVSNNMGSGNDDLTIIDSTKNSTLGRLNLVGGTGINVYYRHNAFRSADSQPSGRQLMVVSQSDGEYESCRGFTHREIVSLN